MAGERVQEIRELFRAWQNERDQPGGYNWLQTRLLTSDTSIAIHELDHQELTAVCLGLTEVLLVPGQTTGITPDHVVFWAWIGEVLCSQESRFFVEPTEGWLQRLCAACILSTLVKPRLELSDHEDYLLLDSHLILAYLVFPFFEAVLKKVCNRYVDYEGNVIQGFSVPQPGGGTRTYTQRNRCNSVSALLHLLYHQVADAELKRNLDTIRAHLGSMTTGGDAFDEMYAWRNQSLHGQTSHQTVGGTLLNLVALVALNQVKGRYDQFRPAIVAQYRRKEEQRALTGQREMHSFYPP